MARLDDNTLHARKGTGFLDAAMANGGKSSSEGGTGTRPQAEEQPFDRWLRKQLHAMYDEVVNEPLDELVKLIEDDAAKARGDAGDDVGPLDDLTKETP